MVTSSTPDRKAWVNARLASYHAEQRAKNPALTKALDMVEAAFPPAPVDLAKRYPFLAMMLDMAWANEFGGATVLIGETVYGPVPLAPQKVTNLGGGWHGVEQAA